YRRTLGTRLSVDAATFYNVYDRLRSLEPTAPAGIPIVIANNLQAHTAGLEIKAEYHPFSRLQLHTGYAFLSERLRFRPGSRDATAATAEADDPRHQL